MKILISIVIYWQFIFCFVSNAIGQTDDGNFAPPVHPKEIKAHKVNASIQLDGKLDENDWIHAASVSDFFRREPVQGGDIRFETEVKFLYDEKNLYIGAFCKDSLGSKGIRVQDLRRDFEWGENDLFGVSLDPQNLKQYAQCFQTTPFGNQRDFQNFNGNNFDVGWNTLWKVRTQRTADGYTAEFAIPFKTLRYDFPKKNEEVTWGITMVRYARREIEENSFPAIPQSFTPYRMTYAAKLTDLKVPKPSTNMRIEPYALYQFDQEEGPSNESENSYKLGGDIKWAINPSTVLDLTFNTDFAQANLDRAVNNLERFNIFFPERRQFFLENSGIWAGGLQNSIRPFFSRRIGLKGNFNAETAPIQLGTRFTKRTESHAIAALFVRQGSTYNSQASNFGIARYLKNYGRENNVGIMVTQRIDEANPNLDLPSNYNSTLSIDGQIRPTSELDIQYLFTSSYDKTSGEIGYAGRFFIGNSTNKYYAGWVTEYIDNEYDPGIGFIRQKNVIRHNPGGYYIWRPKKLKWIRRWDPGVFFNYDHDASNLGNFQQGSIDIFPVYVWFKDNSFLRVSIIPTWQNINFNFAPLGIQIDYDNYFYTRYFVQYYTDQSKKWSSGINYSFGEFYNGSRSTFELFGRIAPLPHLALTANYEYTVLANLGIDNQNLSTHLLTFGSRFALNPRVQLSTFYQYNSFDNQGRFNLRFSWEYQPLSFVYIVFNNTETDLGFDQIQNRQLVTKATIIKQF